MRIKLIIVSPKYQNNLGYIARVAKNFGVERLNVVSPRIKLQGKAAIMYAKHARDLLESAKVYPDFEGAISDCNFILGTTGVWQKAASDSRNVYSPDAAIKKIGKAAKKGATVALVIGRDDIGLTKDELDRCNIVVHIPTNPDYPVLNISHALAIMLYALSGGSDQSERLPTLEQRAQEREMKTLFRLIDRMIEKKKMRDRKGVAATFKRLIAASQPSEKELHALITALK
ncbi:MAG: TrmJ/YjtD family RNA methyltransferase [Candidatus Micrarchaeota archaeon]|nr:TrmJ/YjtD family RNA methyltransferase [Candidatus Micrarchaeota archaeon]